MPRDVESICETLQPQLAAYALGESNPDAALLTHVVGCPTCQADLQAYADVAGLLPYGVPAETPSPALRSRILQQAATQRPWPPRDTVVAPTARRRRPVAWRGFVVAAVIFAALLGWNVRLQQQVRAQAVQLVASRDGWHSAVVILNAADVRGFALSGMQSSGHLWATSATTESCLVLEGLPRLAVGEQYQVWLMHGTTAVRSTTLRPTDTYAWTLLNPTEALTSYDGLMITAEPISNTGAPTGPRIVEGRLDQASSPMLPALSADRSMLALARSATAP